MSVPRMITMEVRQWQRKSFGYVGIAYNDTRDIHYNGEYCEIHDVVEIIDTPNNYLVYTALHTFRLDKIEEKKRG